MLKTFVVITSWEGVVRYYQNFRDKNSRMLPTSYNTKKEGGRKTKNCQYITYEIICLNLVQIPTLQENFTE